MDSTTIPLAADVFKSARFNLSLDDQFPNISCDERSQEAFSNAAEADARAVSLIRILSRIYLEHMYLGLGCPAIPEPRLPNTPESSVAFILINWACCTTSNYVKSLMAWTGRGGL